MTTSGVVTGAIPSAETVALLGRSSSQVLKLPNAKSDRVEVVDWEERVSARKLEKQAPRPRALRLTPTSRNSPAAGPVFPLLSLNVQGTVIGAGFTIAEVLLVGAVISLRKPVASLPTHS